ncbi:MAG TPA: putative glycolipid-binding domain-containing protein [Gemmatimonadaceae bacterium]|nr:putative glycolipid-binding domain-containing protein [Gemmatimonadaceae bacterium]
MIHSIVWRRIDKPGHEYCLLREAENGYRMSGVAILTNDKAPHCVEYEVQVDGLWRTLRSRISEHGGSDRIDFDIRCVENIWTINGVEVPAVAGCGDIDFGFSPATNFLAIRRLGLQPGQSAPVRSAWVRFPEFTLEPLEQKYTRIDAKTYRYESDGGRFSRDIKVSDDGFVLEYPGLWVAESAAR